MGLQVFNRNRLTAYFLGGSLAIVLSQWTIARGQTYFGSIHGDVLDSNRLPLPAVEVVLQSSQNGLERRVVSDIDGSYRFELVPPGKYILHCSAEGMADANTSLEVVVAKPVRVNLILSVRSLKQEVRVVGENGVSVQTENASLGRTVTSSQISDLPSINRSPYTFIALVPGATYSNDQLGVDVAVNGGRTQSANYLLDGGENNDTVMSAPGVAVPLDAVQEFTVQTNHFSAEYGRNSGFISNLVTKSGTNEFHGSVYDYARNSAFAANTPTNNANNLPKPVFDRHQFGGSLGGPVRKSKLFFFAAVEPILVRSSGPSVFYVPTPELLAIGSPATKSIFQTYPLPLDLSSSDVLKVSLCPFGSTCDPQSGTGFVEIPAFAFTSRVGPIDAGAGAPQNTVLATGRLDWAIDRKTNLFVRYSFNSKDIFGTVNQPYSPALDVPLEGGGQNAAVSLTHTWTPRLLTESRLGYTRIYGDPERYGGMNPVVPQPPFPAFYIQNLPQVALPAGSGSWGGPENMYQFVQTATWSPRQHVLRLGWMYIQRRENLDNGRQVADATFRDAQTFVDGVVDRYTIALNPNGQLPGAMLDPPFGPPSFRSHYRYNETALFVEDSWKLASRLVLTPGLRWEYFGVLHSPGAEHDLDSNFYPGGGSSQPQQVANGRVLQTINAPGDWNGRFYLPTYNAFAPRLGVAYDLFGTGKSVIRSGVGVFYDRRVGWELNLASVNPPSFSLASLTNIVLTPEVMKNQYSVFPDTPVQLSHIDIKAIDTHLRPAYVVSWNATFEQELWRDFVFGASYLGSSGSWLYSINPVNRTGSGGLLDPSCIVPRLASDGVTVLGPDYTNCPSLNPLLNNISVRGNLSHSSYEALQLSMESRQISSVGLQIGFNYTWSHSIDNRSVSGTSASIADLGVGNLDAFRSDFDRGSSDFDVRHRFAANWIWQIPLGKKVNNWRSRYIWGGWEISGILAWQSGQPFSVGDFGVPDLNVEATRPRLTGPPPRPGRVEADANAPNSFLYLPLNRVYDPETGLCMANTAPFACEISVNGPFNGTLPRNTFRQPGLFFHDAALLKNVPLSREGLQLQFRAEFFNFFNHPNLYVNGASIDVSNSSFTTPGGQFVPGVTASYADNRQIVLAAKILF